MENFSVMFIEDKSSLRCRKFFKAYVKLMQISHNIAVCLDEIRSSAVEHILDPNCSRVVHYADIPHSGLSYDPKTLRHFFLSLHGKVADNSERKCAILFDTLTPLLFSLGANKTAQLLHSLRSRMKILAVVHADLLDEKELNLFKFISSNWCSLFRSENQSIVLECRPKNEPKKVSYFEVMDDLIMRPSLYNKQKETINVEGGDAMAEKPLASFNLSLNEREYEAKQKLVLPFMKSTEEERRESGRVIYYADKEDDIDEDDPDDDLDI